MTLREAAAAVLECDEGEDSGALVWRGALDALRAAVSEPDPRDARIAELEAALAGADPSTHCATGCESCEQAGERVRAALSGGTPTLDRLVREATDAGRRKGLEEAAKVCEREGANEDNYGRGMDAEDMAHIIIAAVRALMEASDGE